MRLICLKTDMKNLPQLTAIALSLIINTGFCQEIKGVDAQENLNKLGSHDADIGVVRKFDNRYEGVKGSPFYQENWSEGQVIFESGRVAENIKIKYNMYEDELLIFQPETGAIYVDKNNVRSFALKHPGLEKQDWFIKYPHPKKEGLTQYFRVVFRGRVNLLEHNKIVFEKANYQGGYSNDKRFDEFKNYRTYYFADVSALPKKLKSSAGGVAKIFPDNQSEVKKFIIENLLDCRKLQDLVQIFEYYETIP
jgi:hypothetical protein